MRWWWTAVAALALAGFAGTARAQPAADAGPDAGPPIDAAPAEPEGPFERGVALRRASEWAAACAQFDAAVRLDPTPSALLARGECYERDADFTLASVLYRAAEIAARARGEDDVAGAATASDGRVRARTFGIELDRGQVEFGAWVAYSVDGRALDLTHLRHTLRLAPGRYEFRAVRPGCATWSHAVEGAAGDRVTVKVSSLRCYEPEPRARRRFFSGSSSNSPSAAYWTAAVGGFGIGVALFLEFQASGKRTNARAYGCDDDSCRDPVGREYRNEAEGSAHRGDRRGDRRGRRARRLVVGDFQRRRRDQQAVERRVGRARRGRRRRRHRHRERKLLRGSRRVAVVAAAALLAGIGCEPARRVRRHTEIEPGFRPVQYRVPGTQFDLANGLKVVLLPQRHTNLVRVSVRYEVGSVEDPDGKAGLAHLVEHMLFASGPDKTALSERLAAAALFHNGYTSWDQTHYYATALADQLESVLSIEADRMSSRCEQFDDAVLERERDVVQSEIRERAGPYAAMRQRTLEAAYSPGHVYARSVSGSRADVRTMSMDDVCKFVADYYAPERAVLIVSGKFDEAATVKHVERLFGPVRTVRTPPREIVDRLELAGTESEHRLPIERATAVIVTPGKVFTDREAVYEHMLASIVDDDLDELVEDDDNIAVADIVRIGGERAPLNAVVITVEKPEVLKAAVDVFFTRRDGLRSSIDTFSYRRTSTSHVVSLLRSVESLASRDHLVASFVQHGNSTLSVEHGLQWRMRASASILRKRMTDYFARDKTHVAYFYPSKTKDRRQRRRSVEQVVGGYDIEDQRVEIDPEELDRDVPLPAQRVDVDVKEIELDNGLQVRLVPDLDVPIAEVRLVFSAGRLHEPTDSPGLAAATARLIELDLDGHWWPDDRRFVGNALRYSAPVYTAVGETSTTFRASSLATHLDSTLWAIGFLVEDGRHTKEDLEKLRGVLAHVLDDDDRDHRRREDAARRALFGERHPYAAPGLRETTAERLTVEAMREFGREHYRTRGALLVVAGKFDVDSAERVIRDVFGQWNDHGAAPAARQVPAATPGTRRHFAIFDEDLGQLGISFAFAPPAATGKGRAALDVLREMLQAETLVLRTKLASTYGITVTLEHRNGPGQLLVQGDIDAERGAEAFTALRGILDRFRAGTDLEQPFLRARRRRLASVLAESLESTSVAARIVRAFIDADDDPDREARDLATLRLRDVQAVIDAELRAGAGIVVLSGPKDAVEAAYSAAGITDFETLD